jgi:hypothetical protein
MGLCILPLLLFFKMVLRMGNQKFVDRYGISHVTAFDNFVSDIVDLYSQRPFKMVLGERVFSAERA